MESADAAPPGEEEEEGEGEGAEPPPPGMEEPVSGEGKEESCCYRLFTLCDINEYDS